MAAEHATGVEAKKLMPKRIPTVEDATTAYLARPKRRSNHNKESVKKQVHSHLKDWLKKPLDGITKDMCVKEHARIAPNGQRAAMEDAANLRAQADEMEEQVASRTEDFLNRFLSGDRSHLEA